MNLASIIVWDRLRSRKVIPRVVGNGFLRGFFFFFLNLLKRIFRSTMLVEVSRSLVPETINIISRNIRFREKKKRRRKRKKTHAYIHQI